MVKTPRKNCNTSANDADTADVRAIIAQRQLHPPLLPPRYKPDGALIIDTVPAVVPVDKQMPDADGNIGAPAGRVVDTIDAMHIRGSLDDDQHRAAMRFRDDFDLAFHGRGGNSGMPRAAGPVDPAVVGIAAKDRLDAAMQHMGGHGTPGADAVWHIAGEGDSLLNVSRRLNAGGRHSTNQTTLSWAMRQALSALAAHYGMIDKRHPNFNHHSAQLDALGKTKP